MIRIDVNYFE